MFYYGGKIKLQCVNKDTNVLKYLCSSLFEYKYLNRNTASTGATFALKGLFVPFGRKYVLFYLASKIKDRLEILPFN